MMLYYFRVSLSLDLLSFKMIVNIFFSLFFSLFPSFPILPPLFFLLSVSVTLHLPHIPPLCHRWCFIFFPMVGLNENKLDERIDMNQQNLNNKISSHKIEKTKTPIWTYLHKKTQNPSPLCSPLTTIGTPPSSSKKPASSTWNQSGVWVLGCEITWKYSLEAREWNTGESANCRPLLLQKWPCTTTTVIGPTVLSETQAMKLHDLVPVGMHRVFSSMSLLSMSPAVARTFTASRNSSNYAMVCDTVCTLKIHPCFKFRFGCWWRIFLALMFLQRWLGVGLLWFWGWWWWWRRGVVEERGWRRRRKMVLCLC